MNIHGTVVRCGAAVAAFAATAALGACSVMQSPAPASAPVLTPAPATGGAGPVGDPGAATPAQDQNGVEKTGNQADCTKVKVTTSQPLPVDDSGTQWKFPLMLTNKSDATCTVRGFPGVRLTGADGSTWDLTRTNKPIMPVVLRPGEHADADLTYLPDDSGNGWQVSGMAVTPPNTTDTQSLAWAVGKPIVKQDGATRPGTYIDPARPGARS